MRNELAAKTVAALKNAPTVSEASEPDYAALNNYLGAHYRNRDTESLDNHLREILYYLGAPLVGGFLSSTDPYAVTAKLLPCLQPNLPTLCSRTVRALRFIASTCGDKTLSETVSNALAGLRPENGRGQ